MVIKKKKTFFIFPDRGIITCTGDTVTQCCKERERQCHHCHPLGMVRVQSVIKCDRQSRDGVEDRVVILSQRTRPVLFLKQQGRVLIFLRMTPGTMEVGLRAFCLSVTLGT
jgi:hypothetical protein